MLKCLQGQEIKRPEVIRKRLPWEVSQSCHPCRNTNASLTVPVPELAMNN